MLYTSDDTTTTSIATEDSLNTEPVIQQIIRYSLTMTTQRTMNARSLLLAMAVAATMTTTIQGFALSPSALTGARCATSQAIGGRSFAPLFLSDAAEEADPKTKLALDLKRLFDIDQMAYTVMVSDDLKGDDGKLTPDQLIVAIQKDTMFGEDFEEYCEKYASEGDINILDIGKFSDDMESSAPLPEEDNLIIPGKGNYLVHLSFAEGILATMRVVVG